MPRRLTANAHPLDVLVFEVSATLAAGTQYEEVLAALLGTVGATLGYDVGEAWTVDDDAGLLRYTAGWQAGHVTAHEFFHVAKQVALSRGQWLAGQVWSENESLYVANVLADDTFLRARQAMKAGLRCAFGFPLRWDDEVVGVMSFFGRRAHEPTPDASLAVRKISTMIGHWIARTRGSERSEGYFRALVEQQADVVTVLDVDGTIRYESPAVEAVLGYLPSERIGKNVFDFVHADDIASALAALRAVFGGSGRASRVTIRERHRDGSWCHLDCVARTFSSDGVARAIVTSRRAAEDAAGNREQAAGNSAFSEKTAERPPLTPQQRRILTLAAQGLTNRRIAEVLALSPDTVKEHMGNAMRALRARNRTEGVLVATRMGLI